LNFIAVVSGQKGELLARLDALGDRTQTEVLRYADDRANDRPVFLA
jgi:hypothetical protein